MDQIDHKGGGSQEVYDSAVWNADSPKDFKEADDENDDKDIEISELSDELHEIPVSPVSDKALDISSRHIIARQKMKQADQSDRKKQ